MGVLVVATLTAPPAGRAQGSDADARAPELAVALARRGFESVGTRDGVAVFKHRQAPDIRLVAEGVLPVPMEAVERALLDYEAQRGRVERLAEVEVLERAPQRLLVYQRLALPVISDRDQTLDVRWGRAGAGRWVRYELAPDAGPPPKDGVVRLAKHSGRWQILPGPQPGTTRLRFHVTIDMGGLVPKGLTKAGAGRDLPALFSAICHIAAESLPDGARGGGAACP
jgi:hypothetical protein